MTNPPDPDPAGKNLHERIERVAHEIEGLRAALEDEVELRDTLIAEAVDAGCGRNEVARWARVTPARVHQVRVARLCVLQDLEDEAPI